MSPPTLGLPRRIRPISASSTTTLKLIRYGSKSSWRPSTPTLARGLQLRRYYSFPTLRRSIAPVTSSAFLEFPIRGGWHRGMGISSTSLNTCSALAERPPSIAGSYFKKSVSLMKLSSPIRKMPIWVFAPSFWVTGAFSCRGRSSIINPV